MNNLENLGFDNWLNDKVDLSKIDFSIVRVISVNPQTPSTRRAKTIIGLGGLPGKAEGETG
jgi:hypothetical protein